MAHEPRKPDLDPDDARRELAKALSDLKDQEARNEASEKDSEEAIHTAQAEASLRGRSERSLKKERARVAELESQNRELLARLREYENILAASQEKGKETTALLATRTADLRAAEAFLNKADGVADSDVLGLVTILNTHVHQTACSITDAFLDRRGGRNWKKDVADSACESLETLGLLPNAFLKALRTGAPDSVSVLLQVGIQGVMVAYAHRLCSSWDLVSGHRSRYDRETSGYTWRQYDCETVHKSIRAHELQPVAGRWRALYQSHSRTLQEADRHFHFKMESKLARRVAMVLCAGGVPNTVGNIDQDLLRTHGHALGDVVRAALEFRQVAKEKVISREFAVETIRTGKSFDPERMEDEWADPRAGKKKEMGVRRTVLCCAGLGLSREETLESGVQRSVHGSKRRVVTLLKPSVVLDSMFAEL
ncbi:uncharacterized protein BXZ73DRAFT_75735 [Epithele typhae]|uniref:uncharacterized protein n=1 Tax=Epithele typhae TaxID=378194 RepID=UPI00200757B1|nr:uncharacterized protein BXZ73DRAFT_75735 [Epithele typhae]KAH9940125.1 hypothetical protein BXZ73DRAFT_75735 [Epithele typhae]